MTHSKDEKKLVEYFDKAIAISKGIFEQQNAAVRLHIVSKEFEEDSYDVPRSSIRIEDLLLKFFKD